MLGTPTIVVLSQMGQETLLHKLTQNLPWWKTSGKELALASLPCLKVLSHLVCLAQVTFDTRENLCINVG